MNIIICAQIINWRDIYCPKLILINYRTAQMFEGGKF